MRGVLVVGDGHPHLSSVVFVWGSRDKLSGLSCVGYSCLLTFCTCNPDKYNDTHNIPAYSPTARWSNISVDFFCMVLVLQFVQFLKKFIFTV